MNELVPELGRREFKGSFPHFKRAGKRALHLLSVQFKQDGGAFVVEIAAAPLSGIAYKTGWQILPNEVTVGHASRRLRLGALRAGADHWFSFETTCEEDPYSSVAKSVIPYLENQAESWWREEEKAFAP